MKTIFVCALLLVSVQLVEGAVQYQFTDLGTLGGLNSIAYDVNESGWVVGEAAPPGGVDNRAFLYKEGQMIDLGSLGALNRPSAAYGINDHGQIVGTATGADGSQRAFVWQNGIMGALGVLPPQSVGGQTYTARSINNAGTIVGYAGDGHYTGWWYDNQKGVVWSGTSVQELGALNTSPDARYNVMPMAINDAGVVVGRRSYYGATDRFSSLRWVNGNTSGIIGGDSTEALSVNDSGTVVGTLINYHYTSNSITSWDSGAFVCGANGGVTALLSWNESWHGTVRANDINNNGLVVGYLAESPSNKMGAVLWSEPYNSSCLRLSDFLPEGYFFDEALSINDRGQIVGYGFGPFEGMHAFLLTPIPEPATILLLAPLLAPGRKRR